LEPSPWPDHLRQLQDDLLTVNADYFYPFGFGVLLLIAVIWAASLTATRSSIRRLRGTLAGLGLTIIVTQWVVFGSVLQAYVHITD
jgi:hypothetical protein